MIQTFIQKYLRPRQLHLYTDGSQKGKWGSWAFVLVHNNKVLFENAGRVGKTDSLQMEFQAAIEGLSYLEKASTLTLFTDSKILIDCMMNKNKHPLRNQDQILKLRELQKHHSITWTWVKAHQGIIHNERCDQLCILARDQKF